MLNRRELLLPLLASLTGTDKIGSLISFLRNRARSYFRCRFEICSSFFTINYRSTAIIMNTTAGQLILKLDNLADWQVSELQELSRRLPCR